MDEPNEFLKDMVRAAHANWSGSSPSQIRVNDAMPGPFYGTERTPQDRHVPEELFMHPYVFHVSHGNHTPQESYVWAAGAESPPYLAGRVGTGHKKHGRTIRFPGKD